ncbi:pimeloyl-ACP methyl ester carboxylesterase [Conyzicola lurida]|uniref:Pimeloyl-ACP methyl ester carboxylesterase n=1 Tax=Conyzicola lurida TaxID=1172621 RepID=A0A841ASW8_9MICO|nr:alpha/beta fold hydrolase [Conyzicola lurida]MBB5844891.1 pimeloyl-ACP methyl ester carboxylesterase [Conyzicola lurida]
MTLPLVLLPGLSGSAAVDFAFLAPVLARQREVIALDLDDRTPSRLPDGPFDLVGYSVGAVAAAELALTADVRHLVLVAGVLESGERQRRFARVWHGLSPADRETFARFAALDGDDDPVLAFRDDLVDRFAAANVDAAAITAPTLVIGCAADAVATADQSRALFAAIPDSRYAEVDAGHAVLAERPAEVLGHIEGFLSFPARYPAAAVIPAARP